MKLQYLGDSRDAFKWDLLHWICVDSVPQFTRLLFVPLLTPDVPDLRHGETPHKRFPCREDIRPILDALGRYPRSFEPLKRLGEIDQARRFETVIYKQNEYLGKGASRALYWGDLNRYLAPNTIVFLDPDTGFEPEHPESDKDEWVQHGEVKWLLNSIDDSSAVVVYQHRPQRKAWPAVFEALACHLDYSRRAVVAFESNLAFVGLARDLKTGDRLADAIRRYANARKGVQATDLPVVSS
jgi:hypothetical protein